MTKQTAIKNQKHTDFDDKQLYLRLIELTQEFSLFSSLHQDDSTGRIAHHLKALAKEMNFNRRYD